MAHRQYKEEPGVAVAGDHVSYHHHHHAPHTHTRHDFSSVPLVFAPVGQLPSPLMLCIIVLVFWEIGSLLWLWLWLSFWLFWFYRALHDERTPHWDVCDSFLFFLV